MSPLCRPSPRARFPALPPHRRNYPLCPGKPAPGNYPHSRAPPARRLPRRAPVALPPAHLRRNHPSGKTTGPYSRRTHRRRSPARCAPGGPFGGRCVQSSATPPPKHSVVSAAKATARKTESTGLAVHSRSSVCEDDGVHQGKYRFLKSRASQADSSGSAAPARFDTSTAASADAAHSPFVFLGETGLEDPSDRHTGAPRETAVATLPRRRGGSSSAVFP